MKLKNNDEEGADVSGSDHRSIFVLGKYESGVGAQICEILCFANTWMAGFIYKQWFTFYFTKIL